MSCHVMSCHVMMYVQGRQSEQGGVEAVLQLKHQVAHEAVKNIKIVNMFTHGCPFDSSVISLHTLHYWHWTLIRDNSLIQLQPQHTCLRQMLEPCPISLRPGCLVELQTNLREDFTIIFHY